MLFYPKITNTHIFTGNWQYLQLAKCVKTGYNPSCHRGTNSDKEVGKMFFFTCNTNCCNDCSTIWQILSRFCGMGC